MSPTPCLLFAASSSSSDLLAVNRLAPDVVRGARLVVALMEVVAVEKRPPEAPPSRTEGDCSADSCLLDRSMERSGLEVAEVVGGCVSSEEEVEVRDDCAVRSRMEVVVDAIVKLQLWQD